MTAVKREHPYVPVEKLNSRQRKIYDFLRAHPVGVLSSVDPNGNPHGVVIYFTVDTSLTLRFLTRTATRKYDNLVHHDHAMLTVFDPLTQTTAQVTGVATEVRANDEINEVAAAIFGASLHTSRGGLPPIVKLEAGEYTTFALHPVQIRMAIYAEKGSGNYTHIFESIESFHLRD